MIPPRPPDGLVDNLRRFDPALRLRWGRHQELWLIEVKLPPRAPQLHAERPSPIGRTPHALDWWEGWKDGYLYVTQMRHPIEYPWDFIAAHLKHLSLQADHAKDALLDRLDAAEAAEEAAADRAWQVNNEAAAKQLYDDFAWDQGRRVSLNEPGAHPKEEARDGYIVLDRRVKA